jgi:hypothetical protein
MANTLSVTHIERLMTILNRLSPENLFQDGECARAVARRAEKALKAQWKAIEAELGRAISEEEVWAAFVSTPRSSRVGSTVRA